MFITELLFMSGDVNSNANTESAIWPLSIIQDIKGSESSTDANSKREADYERIRKLQEDLIEIQVSLIFS